jgi:hypothetical protein
MLSWLKTIKINCPYPPTWHREHWGWYRRDRLRHRKNPSIQRASGADKKKMPGSPSKTKLQPHADRSAQTEKTAWPGPRGWGWRCDEFGYHSDVYAVAGSSHGLVVLVRPERSGLGQELQVRLPWGPGHSFERRHGRLRLAAPSGTERGRYLGANSGRRLEV